MAISNYIIQAVFPNGLLLDQLIREMPTVWPLDLFPAEYTVNGAPFGTVTSGLLAIETPRDLTSAENQAALDQFAIHTPASSPPQGVTIATLPAPTVAGAVQFVSDLSHAQGPTLGTMAYSNGVEWRRMADDALVT